MAATVPMTNVTMYAKAASFVGSASAGTMTKSASGCAHTHTDHSSKRQHMQTLAVLGSTLYPSRRSLVMMRYSRHIICFCLLLCTLESQVL